MTTSRDGPGVTRFPGEVRPDELATIKNIVAERAARDESGCVVTCVEIDRAQGVDDPGSVELRNEHHHAIERARADGVEDARCQRRTRRS